MSKEESLSAINENIVNVETFKGRYGRLPSVMIFARNGKKRKGYRYQRMFLPYFYVGQNEKINDVIKGDLVKIEEGYKGLFGEPLKKLVFRGVTDTFFAARDLFRNTYEDDVIFTQRFMIDKDVKFTKNQRILYIDIETDFSLDIAAEKPITSIAILDSFTENYLVFVWRNDITEKIENKNENTKVYYFNDESKMLNEFLKFYQNNYPDIITGWNVTGFDLPYLINRMKKFGVEYSKLSQMNLVTFNDKDKNRIFTKIWGHEIMDLQACFMNMIKGEFPKPPGKSLKVISEWLFKKERKMELSVTPDVLWREHLDLLIDYNLKDVELLKKIDDERGVLDFYVNIQQHIPIKLNETMMQSRMADCYMLKRYNGKLCFPTKRRNVEGELKGGYTLKPKPGFYKNVVIYDFSSMYPNIYITFNISPETLSENGDIQINDPSFTPVNHKTLAFNSTEKGIIPEMLGELLKMRGVYKKKRANYKVGSREYIRYDNMQITTKTLLNSFYGVMSYPRFRLYDVDIANTITHIGRKLLKAVIKYIDGKEGIKVIGGDTDSVMVAFENDFTLEELKVESKTLLKELNRIIEVVVKEIHPGCKKNTMKLEEQKIFKTFVFGEAKKRYAGIVSIDDGEECDKIYARGFEVVRKDIPAPFQKILKWGFRKILEGENTKGILDEAYKKFNTAIKKNSLWFLGFSKTINKNIDDYKVLPQHVRAALYSNEFLKTNFKRMTNPRIVFIKRVPRGYKNTDVLAINSDITKEKLKKMGFEIDWKRYFYKYILEHLKKIIIVADKEYARLINDDYLDQKRIGDYIGGNTHGG